MSRITESLYRVNGIELSEGSNRKSKSIRRKRNKPILNEDMDYNAKRALDDLNSHINDVITDVVYEDCRNNGYYTEDEIASKVDEAIKFTFEYLREDIISTVKELLED